MFRKVIPRIVQNVPLVQNVRFSANVTDIKLEKSINQITLLGRVGADPQKRGSEEHPLVIFSLATHSTYKYINGDVSQRTEWHKICVFNPHLRDTVFNYLRKGQRVLVTGKLSYSEYKVEEGHTKPATAIIANDIIFFHQ